MNCQEVCWQQGFEYGGYSLGECPYPKESIESRNWQLGWVQGTLKRLGFPYSSKPENLFCADKSEEA
jgi:hypothetical protein